MATGKELDELIQYHNKEKQEDKWKSKNVQVDRKFNETDANDDGGDDATPHFTACVALHIEHTHKYIH